MSPGVLVRHVPARIDAWGRIAAPRHHSSSHPSVRRHSYSEGSKVGAKVGSINPRANCESAVEGSTFHGPVTKVDGAPLTMNDSTRGSPSSVAAFGAYLATHCDEGTPTIIVASGPGIENVCTATLGCAQNSKTHELFSLDVDSTVSFEKSQRKLLPAAREAFHNSGDARATIVGLIMISPMATMKKSVTAETRTCTRRAPALAPHPSRSRAINLLMPPYKPPTHLSCALRTPFCLRALTQVRRRSGRCQLALAS